MSTTFHTRLLTGAGTAAALLVSVGWAVETSTTTDVLPDHAPLESIFYRQGPVPDAGQRVFADDSFWYKRLPQSTPTDPRSEEMVPWLRQVGVESFGNADRDLPSMTINTSHYSPAVYRTDAGDPLVTVRWSNCLGQPQADQGFLDQVSEVRIPEDAVAGGGSDAHMALYDTVSDRYTDLWVAEKIDDEWTACWGGTIEDASSSPGYFPSPYGATAAGLPFEPGTINAEELAAGTIDHVLAMSAPVEAVNDTISWPAQRTDGESAEPLALSEGQRLRLPAELDLESMHLNPTTLAVARAAQEYGIVVVDRSGAFTFHAESPNQLPSDPYPELFGGLENYEVLWGDLEGGDEPFPFDQLEVLPVDHGVPAAPAPAAAACLIACAE